MLTRAFPMDSHAIRTEVRAADLPASYRQRTMGIRSPPPALEAEGKPDFRAGVGIVVPPGSGADSPEPAMAHEEPVQEMGKRPGQRCVGRRTEYCTGCDTGVLQSASLKALLGTSQSTFYLMKSTDPASKRCPKY